MSRRRARKHAFLVLFQSDVNESPVEATFERWLSYRGDLEEYAVLLARGVEREREDLDALLSAVSVQPTGGVTPAAELSMPSPPTRTAPAVAVTTPGTVSTLDP